VSDHKRLRFTFENSDGATEVESLWAIERADGYEVDNIPFYAKGIASGDIVAARKDEDGLLWFADLIKPGGHSTVRLLLAREEDVSSVRERLRVMGCASEVSDVRRLISVDIPPAVDYESVRKFLDEGEREGHFEYEEGCLGQRDPERQTE
jgi:hypothetical protein